MKHRSIDVINDRETARFRNFGFVTFNNEKSRRDAIEGMNCMNLGGRSIIINEVQSRSGADGLSCGGDGYECGDCCEEAVSTTTEEAVDTMVEAMEVAVVGS